MNKNKLIAGFIMVILAVGMPLTLIYVKKQQDTRSRAQSVSAVVLSFPVKSTTITSGQKFAVPVYLNTNGKDVSAIDFTLSYTSENLSLLGFSQEGSQFQNVYDNTSSLIGSFRYIGTSSSQGTLNGTDVYLGQFVFAGATKFAPVETKIGVSSLKVAGIGDQIQLESTFKTTIITINPIPTPTPFAMSPTPTPSQYTCTSSTQRPNGCQCDPNVLNQCAGGICGEPYVIGDDFLNGTSTKYGTCSGAIPTPTCVPRPACLDIEPRCLIPDIGYCPPSYPTPTCAPGVVIDCAPPPFNCKYTNASSCSCGTLICTNLTPTPTPIPFDCTGGKLGCVCYSNTECASGYCKKDTPDTSTSIKGVCSQPPVTPTPFCKTGINSFSNLSLDECKDKYKKALIGCYDRYQVVFSADTCVTKDEFIKLIGKVCSGRTSCSPTVTPTPTKPPLVCDFDKDGSSTISDYTLWLKEIRGLADTKNADCDKDGEVTIFDYAKWLDEFRKVNRTQ